MLSAKNTIMHDVYNITTQYKEEEEEEEKECKPSHSQRKPERALNAQLKQTE